MFVTVLKMDTALLNTFSPFIIRVFRFPAEDPSIILREHFRTINFFLTHFVHAISRKRLGRFL